MRDEIASEGGHPGEASRPPGERSAECPDPNLLIGLAEDTLLPDERDRIEEHWTGCDACRDIVATLVRERRRRDRFRNASVRWCLRRWRAAAASAVAVAAVVIGIVVLRRGGPEKSTEELLAVAAGDLAASGPEQFDGFVPFDRDELAAISGEVERGSLVLHEPAGVILTTSPEFGWALVPGVRQYSVVLRRSDGSEVWRRATADAALGWPEGEKPLARGRKYVWEVSGRAALGEAHSTRGFTVASEDDVASFKGASEAIAERIDGPIAHLVRAHLALRQNLMLEAARAAREFVAVRPEDPLGRATLDAVRRLLGESAPVKGE